MRRLNVVLLLGVAAGLAILPVLAGSDAHAMPSEPGVIVATLPHSDRIYAYYPNGTPAHAFEISARTADIAVGSDGRIAVAHSNGIAILHPNTTADFHVGSGYRYRAYGDGQYYAPSGVALGPDGRIVLADAGNQRIQVFHSNGTLVTAFGSYGNGSGQFYNPSDVAVGPDGRIVVADSTSWRSGTHRIQVFHPNGTFEHTFGSYGDGQGQFNNPSAVAVGPGGRIVVLDAANSRIQVFHPNGTFEHTFGLPGSAYGQLNDPSDVAVILDGRIAVADRVFMPDETINHRIQIFHPNGTFAHAIRAYDQHAMSHSSPSYIAFGPVMPPNGTSPPPSLPVPPIVVPSPLPLPSPQTPPPSCLPLPVTTPAPYGLDPGMIVWADDYHIRAFHPNGTPGAGLRLGSHTVYSSLSGVAVGPDGRIAVTSSEAEAIGVFHPSGAFGCSIGVFEYAGFSEPSDIALGSDGRIVVADTGNDRIQVFHPNGTFALAFGSFGVGHGEFDSPYAVAVGPDGRIAVADTGRARIQVFHPNGTLALAVGSLGVGQGEFDGTSYVAVGPDGRIVVLDTGNDRIQVFHPNGTFALAIGWAHGWGGGQLRDPSDIAVGPDGRIVVADHGNDRIQVFHPNGTFALAFRDDWGYSLSGVAVVPAPPLPTNGTASQQQLSSPVAPSVPTGWLSNMIAVADHGNNRVQVFHPDGTFARDVGSAGSGRERLNGPYAVAVGPDGRIAVIDTELYCRYYCPSYPGDFRPHVQVFHPNGTFAFTIAPGNSWHFSGASDVDFGPDGRIAVADTHNDRIRLFHPNGTSALDFGGDFVPSAIAAIPDGRIAVADSRNHRIQVFHPDGTSALAIGSYGDHDGQFNNPSAIAVGPNGRIAVADTGNHRIQVFHSNGTFVTAFGSLGDGPGQFYDPSAVAFGPDGQIVVAADDSPRIQIFQHDGMFAYEFGTPGSGLSRLATPRDVALGPVPPPSIASLPPSLLQPGMIVVHSDLGISAYHPNGTIYDAAGVNGISKSTDILAAGSDGRIAVAVDSRHEYRDQIKVFHPDGTSAFTIAPDTHSKRFSDPSDVDFGPDGRIVVADTGNNRVQVFHPNGTLALVFGELGVGHGEFYQPYAVAFGPDGRIAVADSGRARIQVFHPNGTFALAIGSLGDEPGQFDGRSNIAFGPDGRIVVLDTGNDRIQVFHPNGTLALTIGSYGDSNWEFYNPSGIAVGPGGRIVVADGNYILVFHPDGTFAFAFENKNNYPTTSVAVVPLPLSPVNSSGDHSLPPTAAFVPHSSLQLGLIAVADRGNHRIHVLYPDGAPSHTIGSYGYADGQLAVPTSVAFGPDGRIAVLDAVTDRVQVFHPNGTFALAFGSPGYGLGKFNNPSGVAIGPDGRIVVADTGSHRIQVFHPNGTFALAFGSPGNNNGQFYDPHTVSVGPDGRIAVLDAVTDRVQVFHPNGTFALAFEFLHSWTDGNVQRLSGDPYDIAFRPDGRIVVLDTNSHIQVFHPNGTFALAFGSEGDAPGQFKSLSSVAVVPALPSVAVELPPPIIITPPQTNSTTGQPPPPIIITPPQTNSTTGQPPPPVGPVSIIVELDSSGGGPVNATLVGDAANLAINVTGLTGSTLDGAVSSTVTFPPSETAVITSFAEVSFPPGVTASHVPADGLFVLRISSKAPPYEQVQHVLAYGGSGRVKLQKIVEVGGPDSGGDTPRVTFDRPVRILLEGQAGGRAFYIQGTGGVITPIDTACVADDATRVEWQLGGAGECHMDLPGGAASADKVIYTHHLTLFGTAHVDPANLPRPASATVLQRAGGGPVQSTTSYSAGQIVDVGVRFTDLVVVDTSGGAPYLELRTGSAGARAAYASGGGTDTLLFEYAVRGGDIADRLSYAGADALVLGGSTITAAGSDVPAHLSLPRPGEPGSLSHAGAHTVRIAPEPGRPVLDIGILDDGAGGQGGVTEAALAAAYAFNERQGRTDGALLINATSYDAGWTAGSAAAALRSAHSSGAGPSVYVGPSTDRGLHAAMPYAADNGIVLVSAGSSAPSLAVEGDLTFRLLPSDRLEAEALARLAYSGGDELVHAVLDNATYGPQYGSGDRGGLADADVPPPQGAFAHAFGAALASAAISPLSGTVTLAGGADGAPYDAAAAAAALDASVQAASASGARPTSVVYLGSPEGLAALAGSSASYPALSSASWFASGLSAGSDLLAGNGSAAGFDASSGLSAARWSPPSSAAGQEIDSRLPGLGPGERNSAYAAYDAVIVVGQAAVAAAAGLGSSGDVPDAAAIAGALPAAAAAHDGALGDIALDHAGDLWVPAVYDLWTVATQPASGAGTAAEWSRQQGALDGERACSITLTRAKIDYGPIDSGQTSRPYLQTVMNTGQLTFARVDLTATPWHVDSPGECALGDLPSLPVGLSEIRTEQGGTFSDLAASGTVLAEGLEAGSRAPLWYRLNLAGYADLPQAEITQCATYVVRCS